MKRIVYIFISFALFQAVSLEAAAQRYIPGQKAIQFSGGFVDGVNMNDPAYYFGAALSRYTKTGNRWVYGAEFMNKDFRYKEVTVPVNQITGECGYYSKFLSDRRKVFFLSCGFSGLAGYETSNWGDKHLYDGSTLENRDSFVYGGAISLELEAFLSDRIILLINGRERIMGNSNVGTFHSQFGIGLKFIIN